MANKIKFQVNKDNFSNLIDKLDDLCKIDETIKMKIDNENILIYSMLGGNVMLAFKNYLLKTQDYLSSQSDLDFSLDIIIANGKKFVKNLNFIKDSEKVTMELSYKQSQDDDDIMVARSIQLVGGKLKVNWLAAENYEMRDINKNVLKQRLDLKNRKWCFTINNKDFSDIKKLSSINSNKIINISVQEGLVILSETAAWEMEIAQIETRNASLILNKRFLSCINDTKDHVELSMFDSFILVKDDETNLMLSYEQDFSDEEV
jgi:hypothetical protein